MYSLLYLLTISKLVTSQRRITNGSLADDTDSSNYVVYLVGAYEDKVTKGWMCGGCIIHPSLVLTSAACLYDVDLIYVIAGYRKYVPTKRIETDPCTSRMKKKIVSFCVSLEYASLLINKGNKDTLDHIRYKWTLFDIGIARVDTPFDFFNSDYEKYCSYRPGLINVNYNTKYQAPGSSVVTYGWGHTTYYRPANVDTDYNEMHLRYTSSIIQDTRQCKNRFSKSHLLIQDRVGHVYICTYGEGNLDSSGRLKTHTRPSLSMCTDSRRSNNNTKVSDLRLVNCLEGVDDPEIQNNRTSDDMNFTNTRRNGICQNDHGGPLVIWIGGLVYVIGISSAFQVNSKMQCVDPYLYTSVACASRFISCMLESQIKNRRALSHCDEENGLEIHEKNITWTDDIDNNRTVLDKTSEGQK